MHQIISSLFIVFLALTIIAATRLVRRKVTKVLYQPKSSLKSIGSNVPIPDNIFLSTVSDKVFINKHNNEASLHAWWLNRWPNAKTILYFHGNSYNITYREYMLKICDILHFNILMIDYQGYGISDGKPSSRNILEDSKTVSKFLLSKVSSENVIIWGESLGGTPAIYAAKQIRPFALILFSTFASLHSLLKKSDTNTFLCSLATLVTEDINDYTNNIQFIKKVLCPILILHSKEDDLIPFSNAETLYNNISHLDKRFEVIKGTHSDPKLSKANIEVMTSFLGLNATTEQLKEMRDVINNLNW